MCSCLNLDCVLVTTMNILCPPLVFEVMDIYIYIYEIRNVMLYYNFIQEQHKYEIAKHKLVSI